MVPARALVLGLARSGEAAAALLERNGVEVVLAGRELGNEDDRSLLEGIELVVKSPGVPTEHPLDGGDPAAPPAVAVEPAGAVTAAPADTPTAQPPGEPVPATTPPDARPAPRAPPPVVAADRTRSSALYFVQPEADGGVALTRLTRQIAYTDAPLTRTLEALIAGPTATEAAKGYQSLIPAGTRIESIRVLDGTAFVSFNEVFRYNPSGRAGLEAQLRQVVWTITEFESVGNVQILIGGKTAEYLGPEGIRIRDPLSRESLSDDLR